MNTIRTTLPRLVAQSSKQCTPPPSLFLRTPVASTSTSNLFQSTSRRLLSTSAPRSAPNPSNQPSQLARAFVKFSDAGAKRGIATSPAVRGGAADQVDWTKVATSVGLAAAGAVGLNFALNRETRDAMSVVESSYLNETFKWTGVGLGITAITAKLLHSNGAAARLMALNPWAFMIGGAVLGIGSMMGVYYTEPNSPAHYASWAAFTAIQGVTLSPMFFLNPAVLSRAGLYTLGALGGLSYVGATAKTDQYLWIGGPLLAGLGVILLTSLAPMVMPRMATRTMSVLEHVSAYGGVAVFSGFILYDTQKIIRNAKLAEAGRIPRDPIRESVSLILDAINLFVRIVQVMMLQQRKK